MAVKQYNVYADGNTALSANFKVRHFACKNGNATVLIDDNLVLLLQKIRNHFYKKYGVSTNINSAYRTPAYNKSVGGASNSQHIYGTAADISIPGVTPLEIVQYATYLLKSILKITGGVGLYSWGAHVDTRGYNAFWPNAGGYGSYQGDFHSDGTVTWDDGGTLWGEQTPSKPDWVEPKDPPEALPEDVLSEPAEEIDPNVDSTIDEDSEVSTPIIMRYKYKVDGGKVWQSVGTTNDDGTVTWGDFVDTNQTYNNDSNSIIINNIANGQYYIKAQTQFEHNGITIPCVDDLGNEVVAQTDNFNVTDKPGLWVWDIDYQLSTGGNGDINRLAYVPFDKNELRPIKASRWNLFTEQINKIRVLKGLTEITFSPVYGKSNYSTESCGFTPVIYNEVASAIRSLGGNVSDITSDTVLSAALFTDLRDEFNNIVNTLE